MSPEISPTTCSSSASEDIVPCVKPESDDMGTSNSKQEYTASTDSKAAADMTKCNANETVNIDNTENRYSLRSIRVNENNSASTDNEAITVDTIEEPHDRSDGSDSGLGSEICEEKPAEDIVLSIIESDTETLFLDRLNVPQTSEFSATTSGKKPIKSSLKRKFSQGEDADGGGQPQAKKRRSITFDSVTVYYFPRAQGFTCVPSQGGSTLGMGAEHSYCRTFSIAEHAIEQRRIHRQLLNVST